VNTQAELLSLNRSGLYYQPVPPSPEEVAIKHRIDEIYTAHCYYGYRRIATQLHREGQPINRKTVARYMQEMGLAAVYPGPSLSQASTASGHLSLSAGQCDGEHAQSYLGAGYHVYSLTRRLDVPGGDLGLVFPLCDQLGTRSNLADRLRAGSVAASTGASQTADL